MPYFWAKACLTPMNVGLVFSLLTTPWTCGPIYTFFCDNIITFLHMHSIVPPHKTQNTSANTQIPIFLFCFRHSNIVLFLRVHNITFFAYVYK